VLTVTEQAASMIRELLDHAELPEGAGLRIAQRDDHTALAMTLADQPDDSDLIVADRDISVFLGPMAARRVASQTLDATSSHISAAFYLRD
jgi:Fe-S cluster assembly iron-binding protein IscA